MGWGLIIVRNSTFVLLSRTVFLKEPTTRRAARRCLLVQYILVHRLTYYQSGRQLVARGAGRHDNTLMLDDVTTLCVTTSDVRTRHYYVCFSP